MKLDKVALSEVVAEFESLGFFPPALPSELAPKALRADLKATKAMLRTIKNPTYQALSMEHRSSILSNIFNRHRSRAGVL